ncbi:MAG: T9SS type A sorting domain-containing protein [Flavipsychrobacter sp.]|nr:T9SS type A sorting domain-containing protein [Flavipsychrobacter sp.]
MLTTFTRFQQLRKMTVLLLALFIGLAPAIAQNNQGSGNGNSLDTEYEWGFDRHQKKWHKYKKDRKKNKFKWNVFNPSKPELFYSFNQDFYGNTKETACTPDGRNLSSLEIIDMSMGNMYYQTLFFGFLETDRYFYAYQTEAAKLQKLLPGKGPNTLVDGIYSVDWNTPLKKGKINNSLLAETITLALNMNLTPDRVLEDFPLEAGRWLVTQAKDPRSACNKPRMMDCGWSGNSKKAIDSWRIPANVVNALGEDKTVWGLFCLAGFTITGRPIPEGVSLKDIEEAVEAINEAFHEGRYFIGWSDRNVNCGNYWYYKWTAAFYHWYGGGQNSGINTDESIAKAIPEITATEVKAFPNPFVDRVNFQITSNTDGPVLVEVYNTAGQRLELLYNGNMRKGETRNMVYIPRQGGTETVIYRVTANGKTYSGKLIKRLR